jgi:hypothetical protein
LEYWVWRNEIYFYVDNTDQKLKSGHHPLSLVKRGAEEVLGFLALGPFGLLAPFVHLGAHEKHPCDIQSIGQLGLKSPAPE